jgi:hypothetical protein
MKLEGSIPSRSTLVNRQETKTRKRVRKKMASLLNAVTIPVSILKKRVQEEIDKLNETNAIRIDEHKQLSADYKKNQANYKAWLKKMVAEISKNTNDTIVAVQKPYSYNDPKKMQITVKLSANLVDSFPTNLSSPPAKASLVSTEFFERKLALLESVAEETITIRLNDKEWGQFL